MPWSERQRAMLQAMGLRVWQREPSLQAFADFADVDNPADTADTNAVAPAAATSTRVAAPTAPALAAEAGRQPQVTEPVDLGAASRTTAAVADGVPPGRAAAPDGDRHARIARLDWPALRSAVAGCSACALGAGRRQTVFGSGHHQAHWLAVGEAPGEQEDRTGEPFVGPAGQLLDQMLQALHLTRAADGDAPPARRVYIVNTLKCRPPQNRNPTPEELATCAPHLQRQIALLQPRIILAMGRFAVQALLHSQEPIGKLRGRVHRHQGTPLVVTYHPAYLLRNLPAKAQAWEDLCLAAQAVNMPVALA